VRILLVNAHGDPAVGGAEKHVAELARELSGRGHSVDLLQAFPDAGPPELEGNHTVLHSKDWRFSTVRRLRNHLEDVTVPFRRKVHDVIAEQEPDIVHTHNLPGLGTGIWEICRRLDVPIVHTLHDYYLLCPRVTLMRRDGQACCTMFYCGLRSRRLGRYGGAVGDVIGVSRYVLDRQAHFFPRARRHVIRNPATTELVVSSPPSEKLRTIGFIGSLEHIKGVHVLLDAAPELAKGGCTLVFAGSGRLEPEVRASADRGAVRFIGRVAGPSKAAFFDACDLGVVPSVWDEPGAYTPIEWLSSGRPVLVSARGGIGEMIESWSGAIAVDPTPQAIVSAVERLLEPAAWRDAVARVRPVDSAAAFERWVDEHEDLYESAVTSGAMLASGQTARR
jgi:glycosyltransferase involved in cell wall biosynthesis